MCNNIYNYKYNGVYVVIIKINLLYFAYIIKISIFVPC